MIPAGGGAAVHDPFGGTFLTEVGQCAKRDYERRRKVMETALQLAVPQFESIDRFQDPGGTWHLVARYKNFRPNASAQDERDFSDGTLRLIGLLWVLSDRSEPKAPVLLEEPELSLHAEILKVLPSLLARASTSVGRQVIASSHGSSMLEDPALSPDELCPRSLAQKAPRSSSLDPILWLRNWLPAAISPLARRFRPILCCQQLGS